MIHVYSFFIQTVGLFIFDTPESRFIGCPSEAIRRSRGRRPRLRAGLIFQGRREASVHHAHVKAALPRLRRHAFILAGDRTVADDSVAECLKAYRRDPGRVRPEAVNIDLFRLFHDTTPLGAAGAGRGVVSGVTPPPPSRAMAVAAVAPMAAGGTIAGSPDDDPPAAPRPGRAVGVLGRFQALPPGHRQVLTLVSVEGFSIEECAHVLGLPAQRVGTLLADARRRLAALTV
ncbi:sigma factor-like helix-turn-helix DNA-binding protein [Novispirillum sp. DQ9]|uniref:sigma factor-like helix-turn-helix DNA-binding protein n=1 Tax=Novispirillum sp. DQ9 TaxID=3398612 RepID=UPI003C7A538B